MRVIICAIAKCENEYINDWVNWHLDLGFDEIYLYDNNDADYEPIETRIEKIDKVHIIKIPGAKKFQLETYDNFYRQHNKEFDWCAFIDIDEFIILNKWNNIKELLGSDLCTNYNVFRLNWHMYGDDEKITRDISVPVYDGITQRVKGHRCEFYGKEIVRGGVENVKIVSTHYCLINGVLPPQIMADGIPTTGKIFYLHDCKEAYINHYMTKTLQEFIDQKLARKTDAAFPDRVIDFEYFWIVNKKTPEKLRYIEQWKKK